MSKKTDELQIQDNQVIVTSPEGARVRIPLPELLKLLTARKVNTGSLVLPNGIRSVMSKGDWSLFVYEMAPQVARVKWIAPNSGADFGPGTEYRDYQQSWPYIILMILWGPAMRGFSRTLHGSCEVFWRQRPLVSIEEDKLDYPCLLNASKFHAAEANSRPLSWLCTQHIPRDYLRERDECRRFRGALRALLQVLVGMAFNRSSEHHEERSWYTEYNRRGCDKRFSSPETWQKATRDDPYWSLKAPLISTDLTVMEVAERMFRIHGMTESEIETGSDLARLIFNHGRRRSRARHAPSKGALPDVLSAENVPF